MNKFYLLPLFCILGWTAVFSQNFEWLNHVTYSPGVPQVHSMDLDNAGNAVVAGTFSAVVDFDQGNGVALLDAAGFSDLFVMKVDSNGNFLWANRFGGNSATNDEESYSDIAIDDQDFIYTVGTFRNTVDFLPTSVSPGHRNVFVQKLDATGNQIWARHFQGDESFDYAGNVSVDSQGNVYVSGFFHDSVDFDPGPNEYFLYPSNADRSFIVKLDSAGDFEWAHNFSGAETLRVGGMQVDNSDNVVLSGLIYGIIQDFDPGPGNYPLGSSGSSCVYILKLDSSGNLIWGKDVCTKHFYSEVKIVDLAIDPFDNISLIGDFRDSVDFDTGTGEYWLNGLSWRDMFILNLSSSGDFNWAKRIGDPNPPPNTGQSVYAHDVTSDAAGNVFVTGGFDESTIGQTIDFDGGPAEFLMSPSSSSDQFILKYENLGSFDWSVQIGDNDQSFPSGNAKGYDIEIAQNDKIYTTGSFGGDVDFDPGIGEHFAGQAQPGFFILALDNTPLGLTETEIVDDLLYPNPTSNYVFFDEKIASVVVYDASGRMVQELFDSQMVDLSTQAEGVYTLLLDGRPYRVVKN